MSSILTLIVLFASTALALFLGDSFPIVGHSISAILIGIIIRHTPLFNYLEKNMTKFISKYILKTGIVLLGFTLSLRILSDVGLQVLLILCAVIMTSLIMSHFARHIFNTDPKLSALIGIGTSICGGSAISATAPTIDAEDKDIAISITTMFIYSMIALFVLPVIARTLNFTDTMYGVLAGASVNDVASVVATSFEWSDESGAIATITKLTRTLFLVPLTIGIIFMRLKQAKAHHQTNSSVKFDIKAIIKLVPIFVVLFVLAVIFATIVSIPNGILDVISSLSKLLMTLALVSIGLGVHITQIKKAGFKPIFIGAMCWSAVVLVSVVLIQMLYT